MNNDTDHNNTDVPVTAVTHWHVQTYGEADQESFETIFEALDFAGNELGRLADFEHDGISINGEAEMFEEAYRCFQRSERFAGLAANATTVHKQWSLPIGDRAPHYRDTDAPSLLLTAAQHTVKQINENGPAGFAVWECPVDECAPTGNED